RIAEEVDGRLRGRMVDIDAEADHVHADAGPDTGVFDAGQQPQRSAGARIEPIASDAVTGDGVVVGDGEQVDAALQRALAQRRRRRWSGSAGRLARGSSAPASS